MKVLRRVRSGQTARQARMRSRLFSALAGRFTKDLSGIRDARIFFMLPPAVRGLLIGLYAKRCGYELSRRQLVGVLIGASGLLIVGLGRGAATPAVGFLVTLLAATSMSATRK